ncbi:hypothetical protein [Hymenobacter canadensis]|uniref:Uncharacterized protein n=1 Tax=Hymenobacter canadensis TaxID=2999067 RepID=A0ABY7LRV0_9BACT|nr:hypothetical protein [Hymenobacter canadensis]WBA43142.1 hypothetical protein O3303_06145 [Hymenobacter canadensis]
MKILVSLFLSVLMLASSLLPRHDLAELGRLPHLLEHYRQHQAQAGTLSFGEFLALHYGSAGRQAHSGRTPTEHHGLPLHDCHHAAVPMVCALPTALVLPVAFASWPAPAYQPAAHPCCPSGHASGRWQPPCA